MSKYGADRLIKERDIERQYYANTLRVNLMALVLQNDGKYPWESEEWIDAYPSLSRFLNEVDSEYGISDDDYFSIVSDFHRLSQQNKWMLQSLHESLEKHQKKYVLPKPFNIKSVIPFIATLIIGVLIGWLLL